jgi:hypothetical protein
MPPSAAVRIAGAHDGELLELAGLQLRLRSPKAFPPGQPLTLQLAPDVTLEARTIGSKRLDEVSFELRVRLINMRKETREALERALVAPRSVEGG